MSRVPIQMSRGSTEEEILQKKAEEERTKKAASTQSRQLSDLVNYLGEFRTLMSLIRESQVLQNSLAEAFKFSGFSESRHFWQMSSFSETKALQLCADEVRSRK